MSTSSLLPIMTQIKQTSNRKYSTSLLCPQFKSQQYFLDSFSFGSFFFSLSLLVLLVNDFHKNPSIFIPSFRARLCHLHYIIIVNITIILNHHLDQPIKSNQLIIACCLFQMHCISNFFDFFDFSQNK